LEKREWFEISDLSLNGSKLVSNRPPPEKEVEIIRKKEYSLG
jgi:hypothetical protein